MLCFMDYLNSFSVWGPMHVPLSGHSNPPCIFSFIFFWMKVSCSSSEGSQLLAAAYWSPVSYFSRCFCQLCPWPELLLAWSPAVIQRAGSSRGCWHMSFAYFTHIARGLDLWTSPWNLSSDESEQHLATIFCWHSQDLVFRYHIDNRPFLAFAWPWKLTGWQEQATSIFC